MTQQRYERAGWEGKKGVKCYPTLNFVYAYDVILETNT